MKKYIVFIAIFLLSLLAVSSLMGTSYFSMHDDTQIGRVVSMSRSLLDGQFPVRWVRDLGYGYGYPLFNFYGPLPYYIGGVLVNMGIDPMYATKMMMGLGMIAAPLLAFLVLAPFLGLMGAAVSSVLFMYAPYHGVQLYVRGAVGELYATALLPLIFYGVIAPIAGKKMYKAVAVGAIGITLTILSHTILGFVLVMLYGAWIVIYATVSRIQKKNRASVLLAYATQIGLGILLSAFFWLPAIAEMGYTNVASQIGATANFKDHFICVTQLWYSPWGFGGSTAGCTDGMSFKLGLMHIAMFFYAIFIAWCNRFRSSMHLYLLIFGVLVTGVALFFSLPVSLWVWQLLPNFSYIQYPWRFLSIATFGIAMVGGYAFTQSASFARRIFAVLLLLFVIVSNSDEFMPQKFIQRPLDAYTSVEELHFRVSKISDEYLPKDMIVPDVIEDIPSSIFHAKHPVTAQILTDRSNYFKAVVISDMDQDVFIQKAWFPSWQYTINGVKVSPTVIKGIPMIHVLKGESMIELRLSDTPVERVANILSMLGLVGSLLAYIYYEKNNA